MVVNSIPSAVGGALIWYSVEVWHVLFNRYISAVWFLTVRRILVLIVIIIEISETFASLTRLLLLDGRRSLRYWPTVELMNRLPIKSVLAYSCCGRRTWRNIAKRLRTVIPSCRSRFGPLCLFTLETLTVHGIGNILWQRHCSLSVRAKSSL